MKSWVVLGLGLLGGGFIQGCSDQLSDVQEKMAGVWVLEERQFLDGSLLHPSEISGTLSWVPIDSRRAHVTLSMIIDKIGSSRRFNYAASTYEISTSAITRKRYLLIRQGYRSSAASPLTVYSKPKTVKGKISEREDGNIEISHLIEDGTIGGPQKKRTWVFVGDTMVSSFPDVYKDTWKKVK